MKTKIIAFLAALLLIVLTGCNNAPPNEDKSQPFSFSESNQSLPESEAPAVNESKEVETTPEAAQESEPEKQEKAEAEKNTVNSEQPQTVSETEQAAQSATQLNKADKTEHSVLKPQPDISFIAVFDKLGTPVDSSFFFQSMFWKISNTKVKSIFSLGMA